MKLKERETEFDSSWIVHIYGRNRRLICALEPSHGWTFIMGIVLGIFISILWGNLYEPSATPPPSSAVPAIPSFAVD